MYIEKGKDWFWRRVANISFAFYSVIFLLVSWHEERWTFFSSTCENTFWFLQMVFKWRRLKEISVYQQHTVSVRGHVLLWSGLCVRYGKVYNKCTMNDFRAIIDRETHNFLSFSACFSTISNVVCCWYSRFEDGHVARTIYVLCFDNRQFWLFITALLVTTCIATPKRSYMYATVYQQSNFLVICWVERGAYSLIRKSISAFYVQD